ncbi:MAG: tyrosine-type recombinase/integrase [Bdellovibrionales bacterium]|nr:tyrosine-type recombinase/integrase [Bdellovibrionales bacterium]
MAKCKNLTDEEIQQVLTAFENPRLRYGKRDRLFFLLGLKLGYRCSEMLSLKLKDVLQEDGQVVDRITIERRFMKLKKRSRSVVVHPVVKAAIKDQVEDLAKRGFTDLGTYLFKSRNKANKPLSRMQAWENLQKIFRMAGVKGKLGTHVMRRSFANRVYEKLGKDLFRTMVALGHSHIASTVSYLNYHQSEVDQAILDI